MKPLVTRFLADIGLERRRIPVTASGRKGYHQLDVGTYPSACTSAPLTVPAYRTTRPREREYMLYDGDKLYLLVQLNGRKGEPFRC